MDSITLDQWLITAAVGGINIRPYKEDNISAKVENGDAPDKYKYNIIIEIKFKDSIATIFTSDITIADAINLIYETKVYNDKKLKTLVEDIKNIDIEGKYRINISSNNLHQIVKIE